MLRRPVAFALVALLVGQPGFVLSGPGLGTLKGVVTVEGRPVNGVGVAIVDIQSGAIHRVTSKTDGAFETDLPAGSYTITAGGGAGLGVAQAPNVLPVVAGKVASARIDLMPLPVAAPQSSPDSGSGSAAIQHEPVTCFLAGEFPLLNAGITPVENVARARIYFRSALGQAYFYVEMTPAEGAFAGKLPRPRVEASPITYYLQATTTDFAEVRGPETSAIVVAKPEECPDDKIAAIGPPGEVTVFSAASGLAISPVGFAAGGLALGAGTLLAILAGAAAAGLTTTVVTFDPSTPTPTSSPSATPTDPTPTPRTPTPTPTDTPTPPPPPTPTIFCPP